MYQEVPAEPWRVAAITINSGAADWTILKLGIISFGGQPRKCSGFYIDYADVGFFLSGIDYDCQQPAIRREPRAREGASCDRESFHATLAIGPDQAAQI